MMRSAVSAVLAALATITAALSLGPLFVDHSWVRPVVVTVALVVVVGVLIRTRTRSVAVLMPAQLATLLASVVLHFAPDSLRYGLPTPTTAQRLLDLLYQARETITQYAAPAPVTVGVSLAMVLIIGLVALVADLAATTAESPAIAGMPILALYAVGAANAPSGLSWVAFALPAVLWLLLLAHESREQLHRWVSVIPLSRDEDPSASARRDFARQAVGLAAAGLALTVVAPALIPHLPTNLVADGFKTDPGGGGGPAGRGSVRLSNEIDLRRSLADRDPMPVLRYQTDDPTPPYLRVGVAVDFDDGRARIPSSTGVDVADRGLDYLGALTLEDETRTMRVLENRVRAPQMPTPFAPTEVDTQAPWTMDPDGVVRTGQRVDQYTVSYREQSEDTDTIEGRESTGGDPERNLSQYLAVDDGAQTELEELADEIVTDDGASEIERAQAIQRHLRGPDYTYDLELAPRQPGEHPIAHFLRTKQGYCQQFAATMVQLARVEGIPARFAVGFLPGTALGDERVVRAADAHAWPELYLSGAGWVRFEPTPTNRASVPAYSIQDTEASPTSEPTTSSSTSTPTPTEQAAPDSPTTSTDSRWWRPLLVVLALLALLAILPLTALVLRQRSKDEGLDERARTEREWRRLVDELADLGIEAPPGATPRQAGTHLARGANLGDRTASHLTQAVDGLERARYAPPGVTIVDITPDVDAVIDRVRRGRSRGTRTRAALAPSAARRWWRDLPSRVMRKARRD